MKNLAVYNTLYSYKDDGSKVAELKQQQTACADFPNVVAQRHIFGGAHPGAIHQIRSRPRYLYHAPTPKFHHSMFTRSEVIVLTNKQTNPQTNKQQTPLKTPNALRYATTLGNKLTCAAYRQHVLHK